MNTSELREKSVAELNEELLALSRERFNLRMQQGGNQLNRPHLMKAARRNIARVKTVLTEKKAEQTGDKA